MHTKVQITQIHKIASVLLLLGIIFFAFSTRSVPVARAQDDGESPTGTPVATEIVPGSGPTEPSDKIIQSSDDAQTSTNYTLAANGKRVGIQAGHWQSDSGSTCTNGTREVDINLAIANKAAEILRGRGYTVDVLPGLATAVHNYSADVFIALHVDQCAAYYSGYKISRWKGQAGVGTNGSGDASDKWVNALWSAYGASTGLPKDVAAGHYTPCFREYYALNPIEGGPICGGQYTQIHGISDSTPGAIIEMGWLSGDYSFVTSADGQQKMATGLANGVDQFLGVVDNCATNPSPNSDQIGLYSDDNYCGTARILGIGDYSNPANIGFPNDQLSSIKVGSNVRANLCKDDNYFGGCELLTSDDPHLGDNPIGNDTVSSIQVTRRVVDCDTPSGSFCGAYYNNRTLSGSPTFTRIDPIIDFDWGYDGPGNGVGPDNFSVHWQGNFSFENATYTFTATADDGVRVWVDNNLVIDAWIDQGTTTYTRDVALTSGSHTVKVDYYENGGAAYIKVFWQKVPPITSCNTPTGQFCGEYYNNRDLSGSPTFTRNDASITNEWYEGGPGNNVGPDNFSVYWQGNFSFENATYTFTATADDGIRVWVDGVLKIDAWYDQGPTTYTRDVALTSGNHKVEVKYYENGGWAIAKVSWPKESTNCTTPSGQFCGEYYNNRDLSGSPTFTRNDSSINFDWGDGGPGNDVGPDNFSVRWQGNFSFENATYTFTATADDGIRVWVDNNLLIDHWVDQAPTTYSQSIGLTSGNHTVKMEYYENGGGAVAKLSWGTGCAIPSGQFCGQYYNNRDLSGSPTFTKNDSSINFDWGGGGPGNGVGPDNFSVRWQGNFSFDNASYTFTSITDDGVKVWVDNNLVIDAWYDQGPTSHSGTISLPSGDHTVKMEYYENGGGAVAKLSWQKAGLAYNTAFLTDVQLGDYTSMSIDQIRAFLTSHNSYFRQSIQDVDGQTFDPPTVIAQASSQYQISPKVILVTLQKESSGVTLTTRPSDSRMRFLMGCVSPNTARQQLICAAERFRAYQTQLTNNGTTVSGWRVGVAKTTQDGVSVTPATKAVAGQFTYTPYAGVQWGGNQSTVGGVYLFYYWWRQFGF